MSVSAQALVAAAKETGFLLAHRDAHLLGLGACGSACYRDHTLQSDLQHQHMSHQSTCVKVGRAAQRQRTAHARPIKRSPVLLSRAILFCNGLLFIGEDQGGLPWHSIAAFANGAWNDASCTLNNHYVCKKALRKFVSSCCYDASLTSALHVQLPAKATTRRH